MLPPHAAGIIYGPGVHYLDHLAPLCHLLSIPLIVTDEDIYTLSSTFYPKMDVRHIDFHTMPEKVCQSFDILFHCGTKHLFDEVFFFAERMLNKKLYSIWCPHGNSDKGHLVEHMEALSHEKAALLYGKKMEDFLALKGVYPPRIAYCGNYRKAHFKAHEEFYNSIIRTVLGHKLDPKKNTLLYAPTWNDAEKSSSFFDAIGPLTKNLPSSWQLIIKLHPNLRKQDPFAVEKHLIACEDQESVHIIEDIPLIYPLFNLVDAYLGDSSSIGYDFATTAKPMFLLNQNQRDTKNDPGMYLFHAATEIPKSHYRDIYKIIEAFIPSDRSYYNKIRDDLTRYTFGDDKTLEEIKIAIENLYTIFPGQGLNIP